MLFTQCFPIIVCPTRTPFQSIERQINVFFQPIRRRVLFDCYLGGESFCSFAFFQGFFFRYIVFMLPLFTVLQHSFPYLDRFVASQKFLGSATLCSHQDERSSPTFCSGFQQKLLSKHKLTFCYRSACMNLFFTVSVTQGTQATGFKSAVSAFLWVRKSLL